LLLDDPSGTCAGIPWRWLQLVCEAAQKIGPAIQRFLQRPAVQEGIQKTEDAIARAPAAAERATLAASEYGQIIGWGTGQSARAVAQTQAVTQALTTQAVENMIAQGLTRGFVQSQLTM
jgi:hypothetical protein